MSRLELTEQEFMDSLERVPQNDFNRRFGTLCNPENQTPRDFFENRTQARTWYHRQREMGDPVRIKSVKDLLDEERADEHIKNLQAAGLL